MIRLHRPAVVVVVLALALSACGGGKAVSGGGPGAQKPPLDPANQAADDAAQALLERANRAANRYYPEADGTYEGFDAAAAAELDPEITWVDGSDPAVDEVSIVEATASHLHLITLSAGGLYFCLRGVSQFGRGVFDISRGESFDDVDEPLECVESGS